MKTIVTKIPIIMIMRITMIIIIIIRTMINITLVLIIKEMKFWTKSDLSEFFELR